jgi:hypothetical protein
MCDVVKASAATPTIPRPRWGRLYGAVGLIVFTAAAAQLMTSPGVVRTVFEISVAIAGFGVMGLWLRSNRPALDHERWCACAADTLTIRVVDEQRERHDPEEWHRSSVGRDDVKMASRSSGGV